MAKAFGSLAPLPPTLSGHGMVLATGALVVAKLSTFATASHEPYSSLWVISGFPPTQVGRGVVRKGLRLPLCFGDGCAPFAVHTAKFH
jgi:hypothetical protein